MWGLKCRLKASFLQGHFTQLMFYSNYTGGNDNYSHKWVFSSRQKISSDCACLKDKCNMFHACAAATGNARSPMVERRVDGSLRVRMSAERSRLHPGTSESMNMDSAR